MKMKASESELARARRMGMITTRVGAALFFLGLLMLLLVRQFHRPGEFTDWGPPMMALSIGVLAMVSGRLSVMGADLELRLRKLEEAVAAR
jgi:hypothetical protein